MPETAQIELKPATEIARIVAIHHAPNGIHYGTYADTQLDPTALEQLVQAVPLAIAAALHRNAYCFVPLALAEPLPTDANPTDPVAANPEAILIASSFSAELGDNAICHRSASISGVEYTFLSTRLMQDRFALAFELYINVGHHFVETVGVPETFMHLLWSQAEVGVRGETSQDAWEFRNRALGQSSAEQPGDLWNAPQSQSQSRSRRKRPVSIDAPSAASPHKSAVDEKARTEYFDAAFADAIAIYLLSLTVDFDYTELREREYPLLSAPALAERLRHITQLFPPNAGQEFTIHYRRRNA